MSAPDLGRCRCSGVDGPDHEHSDFEPFGCADCPCPSFQRVETRDSITIAGAESNAEPPTGLPVGDRTPLTIPAEMGFAQERVTQTALWLDEILGSIRDNMPGNPDEPLAVCALADMLEASWPDGIDPYDVIALAARRITDATKPTPRQRAREVVRRMRQR